MLQFMLWYCAEHYSRVQENTMLNLGYVQSCKDKNIVCVSKILCSVVMLIFRMNSEPLMCFLIHNLNEHI